MSFSNAAETAINTYIFVGTNVSWDGNTDLFLALYTADPTETGSHAAEATYGSYARVTMTRASDFTVSGATVENANLEQFPTCSSGNNTLTYAAIVTSGTIGAGTIIASGALNSPVAVATGIQPQFAAGGLVFTLD